VEEWSRKTPWRQGYLLTAEAISALGFRHPETEGEEETVVVVASHDCDLAQSPEGEPQVEVVVGRILGKSDGNCTHAKNARKLHIEFCGGVAFWAEFEATAKAHVSKAALAPFSPNLDAYLSPENHAIFQIWLASRYRRSAFPDEFERRLTRETKLADKIAKAVRKHGEHIVGVFFDVDEGDEVSRKDPDDTYTLDITVLHAADNDDMEAVAESAAVSAVKDIEKAFKEKLFNPTRSWKQIELRFCEAVSESVLSYQQFKQLKRWRLEHISLAAEPQQPAIAE